jgi:hypothetical protein
MFSGFNRKNSSGRRPLSIKCRDHFVQEKSITLTRLFAPHRSPGANEGRAARWADFPTRGALAFRPSETASELVAMAWQNPDLLRSELERLKEALKYF